MHCLFLVVLLAAAAQAFQPLRNVARTTSSLRMSLGSSLQLAELFSSPAVRYGGELVDKSLKLVEKAPKPAGYEYGAVDSAGIPALGAGLLAVVVLAAAVPYFLSIGESAQTQQRVREANDKTVNNQFALGKKNAALNAGIKRGVVVGAKKSGVAAAAAAPAKKASPLSFGGAPKAASKAAAPAAAPAPAKKASPLSFGGAPKAASKAAAPAAVKRTSKIPAFGPR